ncbi:MAG: hypothetical protein FWH21_04635, partial [Kiritimatiellaeota bacterium]|nr:hypothetical protein [Kiritimatiellota bacterium]
MIVPMKHVTLLCVSESRGGALETLRSLELMHLDTGAADSEPFRDAQLRLAANRRAQWVLQSAHADKPVSPTPAAAYAPPPRPGGGRGAGARRPPPPPP